MTVTKTSYWRRHDYTVTRIAAELTATEREIVLLRECKSPLVIEDIHSRRRHAKVLQMALDSHLLRNPPRGFIFAPPQ